MADSGETVELEAAEDGVHQPWSDDRRDGWNAGYLAGLNDATKFVGDALRDAMDRERERMVKSANQRNMERERDEAALNGTLDDGRGMP